MISGIWIVPKNYEFRNYKLDITECYRLDKEGLICLGCCLGVKNWILKFCSLQGASLLLEAAFLLLQDYYAQEDSTEEECVYTFIFFFLC